MPKLTDNQKSLIILGGGLLFAIGFGVMGYLHYGDLQEERAKIEELKKLQAKNEKEIQRQTVLEHEVVAYGQIVSENAKILPTEEDLNQFLRDLGDLEKDTGVSIRVLPAYNPTKDKRDPTIVRIPMKLTLTASTRNFLSFLNELENRERLVMVTDFRINPEGTDAKPGTDMEHDVSMSFDVYKYDPTGSKVKEDLVGPAKRLLLRESDAVKDIISKEGKPTFLERYSLLRVKESRRDMFLDPRRRLKDTGTESVDDTREVEAVKLDALRILYEKAKIEGESYREAEKQNSDFLRRSAAKRAFLAALGQLKGEIQKASQTTPEFSSRDIQDRYLIEVKRPYERLEDEFRDVTGGKGPTDVTVTEETVKALLADMQALERDRKFKEAGEKWLNIEALLKDAGKKVEPAAEPHVEAIRKIGVHSQYQSLLAARSIQVQGVVQVTKRVEAEEPGTGTVEKTVSAVIINGRFLKPGEYLDKDLTFRGVDPDGRLLFRLQEHDVDYLQEEPDLLEQQTAILGQE